jgi:hypothetical protein
MIKISNINVLALSILFILIAPGDLFAQTLNDIAANVTDSSSRIPGLITAFSYLLALLFGVVGILKLKDHVINPTQVPLKASLIRFFAGGALFALPIILEAARESISGGPILDFTATTNSAAMIDAVGNVGSIIDGGGANNLGFNQILGNIVASLSSTPGIITAVSYLLGLLACVAAILKIKDHVETPEQVQLKEGVIRLLIGGALFALPVIYSAAQTTITGVGVLDFTSITPTAAGFGTSDAAAPGAAWASCSDAGANRTLGDTICTFIDMTGTTPAFLASISYLFGMVMGVWALLKIRDHVLNPTQTQIWEGVSRLIATGAFFAMPYVATVIHDTVATGGLNFNITDYYGTGALNCAPPAAGPAPPQSLDRVMGCFMQDVMAPTHILLNFFTFVAGLVFIMIGISRLMKTAQDGPRGPGGLGTITTFIVAGILLSYNRIIGAFSEGIGGVGPITTNGTLTYTVGMTAAEVQNAEILMGSVIQFLIIVGITSFVRGWFIVRQVAEGNGQASMMAGITHIIGGALAINLGPILDAVQNSLGIVGFGVGFS